MSQSTVESLSLAAVSDQLAAAVESAARVVVAVHARERLASTGVHWRDGLILTTDATVRRDTGIEVTLPNGTRVSASIAGRDAASDLALLKLDADAGLAAAPLADASSLKPGHLVMAVARLDDSGPRVSFGAVSAVGGAWRSWKGGEYSRRVQSGLQLYPGFGGSPLINAAGHVLGINSGGLSQQFATTIPSADVERVFAQLLQHGHVARGWLGAAMQTVRLPDAKSSDAAKRETGLLIIGLADNGPAVTSGLIVGDIVLAVSGAAVHEPSEVLDVLDRTTPGATLSFDVLRGGTRTTIAVTVGTRPRGEGRRWRGPGGRR